MRNELLSGFALGLAYAAPIGAQNLFVVSQALRLGTPRNFLLAGIVAFMDITLAIACVLGIGAVLNGHPVLRALLGTAGGIYLLYVAYDSFRSIRQQSGLVISEKSLSWATIITQAFMLTWLNPHAVIDGTAILGSYSAGLTTVDKTLFIIGVGTASATWFATVSTVAASFRGERGRVFVKTIKAVSATTIVYFGLSILTTSVAEWLRI